MSDEHDSWLAGLGIDVRRIVDAAVSTLASASAGVVSAATPSDFAIQRSPVTTPSTTDAGLSEAVQPPAKPASAAPNITTSITPEETVSRPDPDRLGVGEKLSVEAKRVPSFTADERKSMEWQSDSSSIVQRDVKVKGPQGFFTVLDQEGTGTLALRVVSGPTAGTLLATHKVTAACYLVCMQRKPRSRKP